MRKLLSSLLIGALVVPVAALANTQIIIQNNNGPGEGFNDPTPATPVGGNPGTTIGQQRLIAFQYAASIWGATVKSSVPIVIQAQFTPLDCQTDTAVLGDAAPAQQYSNDPSFPKQNVWYAAALANAFAGKDLSPNGPEITADFNSNLGNKGCLDGYGWYYGLDGNAPPNGTQLAVVLLHEFGHGLGFLTFANAETGANLGGQPDIFEYFTFDDLFGKLWSDMSSSQRAASTLHPLNVEWTGPHVEAEAPLILHPALTFSVTSPASIAGNVKYGLAEFGNILEYPNGMSGTVTLVQDATGTKSEACGDVKPVSGIVAINRGSCDFVDKVAHAQEAGASAVVMLNQCVDADAPADCKDNPDEPIGMAGTNPQVTIPSFFLSLNDSAAIRNALEAGDTVSVDLHFGGSGLAGGDPDGGVYLYTPQTYEQGSSVSHFSLAADPPLLMEPNIHVDTPQGLDLTKPFMQDIGWQVEGDHALAMTKLDLPSVNPGGEARYLISVVNHVSAVLSNVMVNVQTPTGLTLKSVWGACTALPCNLGTVNGQSNKSFVVTYDVPAGLPLDTTISESASATSSSFTAGPDDSAKFDSLVKNASDLLLTLVPGPASADSDSKVSYHLTVKNKGPSPAVNTVLKVLSMQGLKLDGFSGDCSGGTCSLGTLAVSDTKSVTANFTITGKSGTTSKPVFQVISDSEVINSADSLTQADIKVTGCSATGDAAGLLPLGLLCLLLMDIRRRRA